METTWGNFVIRKGSIRSSFNAFLIKLKDHPNVGAYERDGWVINRWDGEFERDKGDATQV